MEIISSAKDIQLHTFPDLVTQSKYSEFNKKGLYDFQFFHKKPLFIVGNPELPLEYLTKKTSGEKSQINFIRRLKIENVTCVACPKSVGNNIAVGFANGYVKTLHYKTNAEVQKFSSYLNDGVVYMDFNSTDEYLASVHESGTVNIYGQKTAIKLDEISFDKETTLVKFHPLKKLHLGMASFGGGVTIYDTQAKKKIFNLDAHAAPCTDLVLSPINGNYLISVGYDNMINLFDTRKKVAAIQMVANHPLSAVAMSKCDSFCCVGNLKGELSAYDFRNVREPLLTSKKVHDAPVKRVAFLPDDKNMSMTFSDNSPLEMTNQCDGMRFDNRRDSFTSFFEYHYKRLPEQARNSNIRKALPVHSFASRISLGRDLLPSSDMDEADEDLSSDVEFVCVVNEPNLKNGTPNRFVKEEPISHNSSLVLDQTSSHIGEDEELDEGVSTQMSSLPTSTPNNASSNPSLSIPQLQNKRLVIPEKDIGDGHKNHETIHSSNTFVDNSMIEKMINDKMENMSKDIIFKMENMKWDQQNYSLSMFNQQMQEIQSLKESVQKLSACVECLMRSDSFMQEFFNLKHENEMLKSQFLPNGH